MHIKYIPRYHYLPTSDSVEDLIARKCDGNDYDTGALEAAARTASNTAVMLGSLVELLASRGVLSADDVLELAGISGATDVEMS